MTQYTDKLNGHINGLHERTLELSYDDMCLIVGWYGQQVQSSPMFKELYGKSKEHFVKRVSFGSTKMVLIVMKEDIENAIYWASLCDIEDNGSDEEKVILDYLHKVLKNEHLEELIARLKNPNSKPVAPPPAHSCSDPACSDTNCKKDEK